MKGKRLALFKEMLEFYKYPDPGVLEELTDGVSLVGEVPKTGMLPFKFTPALLTIDALRKQAEFRRAQIFGDCKGSGDSELDAEVWCEMLEERDKGWLLGPLGPGQHTDFKEVWVASKAQGETNRRLQRVVYQPDSPCNRVSCSSYS